MRLAAPLDKIADRFILFRPGNMRGLDLRMFDFDHDLSWAALVMTPDGRVILRFGGRERERSLVEFAQALDQIARKPWHEEPKQFPGKPERVEDYDGAKRFRPQTCIHCHHVYEFRREARQQAGVWKKDEIWVYPEPASLGITVRRGRVENVASGSPASEADVRAGDQLLSVHGQDIVTDADVRYALHRSPEVGSVELHLRRALKTTTVVVKLPPGWRQTDLSWRWSLKSLGPTPGVQGEDLSAEEKAALGLVPEQLAFRQGAFLSRRLRQAGLQTNDIILGLDQKSLRMTAKQFEIYIRLNYRVGDEISWDVVRNGSKLRIPYRLVD